MRQCRLSAPVPTYHATVTRGAHDAQMPNRPDNTPEPTKASALVLRAWIEGPPDQPQLRVRLISLADVTSDAEETAAASTVEGTLAYIRDWLTRFLSATK